MNGRFPSAKRVAPKTGAVLYLRVSTKEQEDNFSMETQQAACTTHCMQKGLNILAKFQEVASAKTVEHRPQFQLMLDYCAKHHKEIRAVVVYSVSRFARNGAEHLTIRAALKKLDIRILSATEDFDESSGGRLNEGLMGLLAQWDNDVRSERTIAGMTTAITGGKFCHRAPVGYINNRDAPGGLVVDSDRAALVRKSYELFDAGYTKTEALNKVRALGLTMPTTGKPVSPQTFDKVLRNPVYSGCVQSKWGITAKGMFPPIIEEDLYDRVQVKLSGNGTIDRQVRSRHSESFPLRVFVKCSGCGRSLTGSYSTRRNGRKYGHYACPTLGCREVKFQKDELHQKFIELLYTLWSNEA
jgi:site-specific DNA recombinase